MAADAAAPADTSNRISHGVRRGGPGVPAQSAPAGAEVVRAAAKVKASEGVASASAPVAEPVAAEQAAAPADAASPASEGGATPAAEDCYWASDSRDAATGAAAPADTSHHISRSFFRLQSCSPNSEQLCTLLSNLKCGATMGLESCITFLGIVSFARWHVENPLAINSKSKLSGNKYRIRLLLERKRQYDKS
jgi:hypothetical protein